MCICGDGPGFLRLCSFLGLAQEGLWPRLFSCPVPPSEHPWGPELGRRLVFIELIGGLLSRQRSGSAD